MLQRFKHFDNGNLYCVLHVCYTEKIRDLDRNKSLFDITTLYFVLLLHKVITVEFLTANKFENIFVPLSRTNPNRSPILLMRLCSYAFHKWEEEGPPLHVESAFFSFTVFSTFTVNVAFCGLPLFEGLFLLPYF